jgi:ABC-type dipeptide/oligopeptide/nickel transport system permease subunit
MAGVHTSLGDPGPRFLVRFFRRPSALVGSALVALFLLTAVAAPALQRGLGHRCSDMPKDSLLEPPSRQHWFGTDDQGRDLLVRLICGSRTSLVVGTAAEGLALILGLTVGAWAGFRGGRTDAFLMRLTDMVLAFPFPLVAIAVVALTRTRSLLVVLLLLGLLGWPGIARLIRARILALRNSDFVQAARASGAGELRVLLRHALPSGMAPVWAAVSVGIAGNILAEAWLSFIGLGDHNRVSWGSILSNSWAFASDSWWFALAPGLAITLTILGFMLLGDALRDTMDPRAATEIP